MLTVLLWLLAIEVIGLATFPLCYYLFPRLSDRGFSISKAFGILLIGYLSWLLSVLRVLPATQLSILALVLAVGALSAWYAWPRRAELLAFFRRHRTLILTTEGVFLGVFVVWVIYRAYDPFIDHTEQPMDFMFLNASIRSFTGAPEDPWLAGEPVSYYYFGYWMMGTLSKLTGISSNVSYNLALALIPALGAAGMFGLVHSIVRSESRRFRHAIVAGLASAVLLVGAANLEGVLEFMRANGIGSKGLWEWVGIDGLDGPAPTLSESWRPDEFYWWWRATRVIGASEDDQLVDYTIHEFPLFSYILGDLHPHVMSVPFVVLFLALCWNYLRSPPHGWSRRDVWQYASLGAMALCLGGLAFTNMWDLPVFAAVVFGVMALKAYTARGAVGWGVLRDSAPTAIAVVVTAVVLISPYLMTFTSQVEGIGAQGQVSTRPFHMFLVWSLFLVAVTPFILGVFWRTTVRRDWARITGASLFVGFAPFVVWSFIYLNEPGGTTTIVIGRLIQVLPFALLIGIAVYSALWLAGEPGMDAAGKVFALALAALGLLLIMGPEMLYVDDSFGGAHERMNTVFKLYYQSWVVLATASGFAVYYWMSLKDSISSLTQALRLVWASVFVAALVGAAYYSLAAAATKGDLFHDNPTLDGLAFINRDADGEYDAVEYLRSNADRDATVLEAVGGDYTPFGRISASTGVPTVLGWPGHEVQWRGGADPQGSREQDVATIYQTNDIDAAKTLLTKYGVDYVYIGPREREKYSTDGIGKFSEFMKLVFDEGGVLLYHWEL